MVMESARRAADLHCLLAVAVGALAAPELTDLSRSRTDVGGASGPASPMPRQVLAAANPGACWRPRATAPRAHARPWRARAWSGLARRGCRGTGRGRRGSG